MAACSTATFEFDSAKGGKAGQQGAIPQLGFGSATLFDDPCRDSIRAAVKAGYRHIDTALLYGNQKEVGEAVAAVIDEGLVTREELWVTTKVGFYPGMATESTIWKPLAYHDCNRKGEANTAEAVDTCLELLGLDYADLILIHNPCTAMDEYHASGCLHWYPRPTPHPTHHRPASPCHHESPRLETAGLSSRTTALPRARAATRWSQESCRTALTCDRSCPSCAAGARLPSTTRRKARRSALPPGRRWRRRAPRASASTLASRTVSPRISLSVLVIFSRSQRYPCAHRPSGAAARNARVCRGHAGRQPARAPSAIRLA